MIVVDASIMVSALYPLITLDREQRERGGQRVDTRTPSNA